MITFPEGCRTIRRLDTLPRREALRATFLERPKLDVHTKAETLGNGAICPCPPTIHPEDQIVGKPPVQPPAEALLRRLLSQVFA
jgi:hypothetical protein